MLLNKIGERLEAAGDGGGRAGRLRAGLAVREALAAADPGDTRLQRDLSISHNSIGDALKETGDSAGALGEYRTAFTIADRLAQADPDRCRTSARPLDSPTTKLGSMLLAQDDAAGALARAPCRSRHHRAARGDRSRQCRLAARSVGHAGADRWRAGGARRRAGRCCRRTRMPRHPRPAGGIRAGECDLAAGSPVHAAPPRRLAAGGGRRAGRARCPARQPRNLPRLADIEPGNLAWQREQSVIQNAIGDQLAAGGDVAGACDAYRAGSSSPSAWRRPNPAMPCGRPTSSSPTPSSPASGPNRRDAGAR